MKIFGKRKLDYKEYEKLIVDCFKMVAIQAADQQHQAGAAYFSSEPEKQRIIETRGPESVYMLTLHIMSRIAEYHIEYNEGSRAAGTIGAALFDWAGFAGSVTHPPVHFTNEEVKNLPRDTKDRSAAFHNNVLNVLLQQKPASISPQDYLNQKAMPCFREELAKQLLVSNYKELDSAFTDAIESSLYRLHKELTDITHKNQIKRS